MDRSHNRNNTINGFEEEKEKEKDDQYHHHHHQVGRRKRRRKDKASLFRETRLYSSVFRIIISDLNFQNLCALFPQNHLFSRRFTLLCVCFSARCKRRALFAFPQHHHRHSFYSLLYSLSLSLSDETTKNAVGIQ